MGVILVQPSRFKPSLVNGLTTVLCAPFSPLNIVVELSVDVVERVNILSPSGLHGHRPGFPAFTKDTIGVHIHYGWRPSDQCTRLPLIR
jgi:hypothetical protein